MRTADPASSYLARRTAEESEAQTAKVHLEYVSLLLFSGNGSLATNFSLHLDPRTSLSRWMPDAISETSILPGTSQAFWIRTTLI